MLTLSVLPMRRSLVCLGIMLFPMMAQGADWDLIIVAGQSNAVGYDADAEQLPADEIDGTVRFWWRCGDPPPDEFDSLGPRRWGPLQPQPRGNPNPDKAVPRQYGNFSRPAGGFGPEMGMARSLATDPGRKLAVLKVAFSGTSLLSDWNPQDPGPAGACYRALVSEFRVAVASAEEQGDRLIPRAFVWVQGESDSHPESAKLYADALTKFIAALRRDLTAPEMLALIGVNTRFGNLERITDNMQRVIEAQRKSADRDPLTLYVDCDGATLANPAHFDAQGTLDVGRRFAKAFRQLEQAAKSR